MSGPVSYSEVILTVQACLLVFLIVRLFLNDLHRAYPFFTIYLLSQAIQLPIVYLGVRTTRYAYAYLGTESLVLCLYALITQEQFSNVFRNMPGIERFALRFVKGALAFAVVTSLLLMHFEHTQEHLMGRFFIFERAIVFSLVLFVLIMAAFLVYYPVPLTRNTVIYAIGYAFYFLSKATMFFTINTGMADESRILTQNVAVTIPVICLALWVVLLNRKGQERTLTVGHRWNPAQEQALLDQLQSINDHLLRTARR